MVPIFATCHFIINVTCTLRDYSSIIAFCESTVGEAIIFTAVIIRLLNDRGFCLVNYTDDSFLLNKTSRYICCIHHIIRMRHFGPLAGQSGLWDGTVRHLEVWCLLDTSILVLKCPGQFGPPNQCWSVSAKLSRVMRYDTRCHCCCCASIRFCVHPVTTRWWHQKLTFFTVKSRLDSRNSLVAASEVFMV